MDSGVTGQPWTEREVHLTVEAYLRMLRLELTGIRYTKASVVRDLQAQMPARNSRAIEAKFQNVSAVLQELSREWISGYKPLPHYQGALRQAVVEAVTDMVDLGAVVEAFESSALVAPAPRQLATGDVLVPVPDGAPGSARGSVGVTGSQMAAFRDFRAKLLGDAGERWVVELEREELRRAGRLDLAKRVAWAARDTGDGLGYDIASFRPDGSEHLIEVKTTNYGVRTPFYITRWELDVSRRLAPTYSLYRVHGFARDPKIYVLSGSIADLARLDPTVFLGIPLDLAG